jgi:AcrR family transcriptional regulator
MPRTTPPDRRTKLLDAAAAAFVEHGFQRTQMDDIAERLGVSKGTIYRTFDSKDALFAAVIVWADSPDDASIPSDHAATNIGALASSITDELVAAISALELTAIVTERRPLRRAASVADEVERLTVGLHRVMRARHTTIMVLDRCAGEIPELTDIWFGEGRSALVDLWADYLELRAAGVVADVDRAILARTIVEIITTWAVKMPWDRAPRPYPDDTAAACGTMVRNLVLGGTR